MNNTTFAWAATLFGTAVGAGILFLPLSAGSYGFWPLLAATLLIGPITYLSHLAYTRIVSNSNAPASDLLTALQGFFNTRSTIAIAVGYLVMLFPVLLVYAVSLTNTVDSFIVNQLSGPAIPRWILAVICVGLPILALMLGEKIMLTATQIIVVPMLIALGAFSLYLMPQWDLGSFLALEPEAGFVVSLVRLLPVLVFSFTFIGSASHFAGRIQHIYGPGSAEADAQQRKIILLATALLTIFTMFFVWSCVLALGAEGMREATEANIPVLSYFANTTDAPILAFITPVLAICAILSSFIGVALGAREGLDFLFAQATQAALTKDAHETRSTRSYLTYGVMFIIATIVAITDPHIISLMTIAGGFLITLFQFGLPMLVIYLVPRLSPLRRHWGNAIIIGFGAIVLATTLFV